MQTPLVSVVIPTFNCADFIDTTLKSALAQHGITTEIIVVDDGSTDETISRVKAYGDRVRLVQQANQGSAVARNRGIAEARADHIAFLDADDYWHPEKLAKQWALVEAGARLVCSQFSLWHAGPKGTFEDPAAHLANCQRNGQVSPVVPDGWIYVDLLLDCIVWTTTVLAEKQLLEQVGGFDTSLRKGQDYDLWLKLSQAAPWQSVKESLALYRMHDESITRRLNPQNFEYQILTSACQKWGLANPDGRTLDRALMRDRLARSARTFADAHFHGGSRATAAKFYRLALGHRAWAPRAWLNYARATLWPNRDSR